MYNQPHSGLTTVLTGANIIGTSKNVTSKNPAGTKPAHTQ